MKEECNKREFSGLIILNTLSKSTNETKRKRSVTQKRDKRNKKHKLSFCTLAFVAPPESNLCAEV